MKCDELWEIFNANEINFFTGVPDSTFQEWMSFIAVNEHLGFQNIVACNECEAVAVAAGYHLATQKIGVVYMQNSGLGKTVNPITSLADPDVYSIPMLLLIGWRGEPGVKDEPQHKKMGRITFPLLDTLEIPAQILPSDVETATKVIQDAISTARERSSPYALIIKKKTLSPFTIPSKEVNPNSITREEAIATVVDRLTGNEVIISTTGKTSRELFETRVSRGEIPRDFYTVGSMGCASTIGLGMALQSQAKIVVLDGDGASLMQMGSLATIGHYSPKNYFHVIFNNNAHDSTGGQPTVSNTVDFVAVANAVGYKRALSVASGADLRRTLGPFFEGDGPALLIVQVKTGARDNLGRPTSTPVENKENFIKYHQSLVAK